MKRTKTRTPRSKQLILGCERLEVRRVLDASAMPIWDQMPEVSGQALTLDLVETATATAQTDFNYTIANGTVSITAYTGAGGAVDIPAMIDGLPVRVIDGFNGKTTVTSVTIPFGAASIGVSAFEGCTRLSGVTIPASLTKIDSRAFYGCSSLSGVSIPSSVSSIGTAAFGNCSSLSELAISSSSLSIGSTAFSGCVSLRSVVLPVGVTSIGSNAFERCTALVDVSISKSVTSIGTSPFYGCDNLATISVDPTSLSFAVVDGVLYNKARTLLIQCPGARAGSLTIPNPVASIGSFAFAGCGNVTNVSLPSTLATIGGSAFAGCANLQTLGLLANVTTIGGRAFNGCTSLESVAMGNLVTDIGAYAFADCLMLRSVTLSTSLKSVSEGLFSGCTSLKGAVLSVTVTSIGLYAFADSGIEGISIPNSVTSIAQFAFMGCTRLERVVIPSSVTRLDTYTFAGCTSLTYVNVPNSVTTLWGYVFKGCSALRSATVGSGLTTLLDGAFGDCPLLEAVYFVGRAPTISGSPFSGSVPTVYRVASSTGWSSKFAGRPTAIFQSLNVGAAQTTTVAIAAGVSRVVKEGFGTAILDTVSTRTAGTVVQAGELVVRNKGALGTGLLEVQAGAKATFQTGYDTVAVTSLSLTGTSRLEIGTGKLTVAANGFTESDIRSKLVAGRNGGLWDGTNGITTTFAGGERTIGYRVADGALEVAYAAPGDGNLDGVIDILDIAGILSAGKFNTGEPANWQQGDTNYDNVFDIVDLADILGTNLFNEGTYLTQGSASSAAADAGTVATFDSALVFAALAAEPSSQPTTKRKSF